MCTTMKELLNKNKIYEYGIIDFEKLTVINERLLPKEQIKSVLFILMPYKTGNILPTDGYNMGLFARITDYHLYFKRLSERLLPRFEEISGGKVFPFADHSPIFEKEGAAKCGLGFIGKNSLLINPTYGSFVFIGCFLFTQKLQEETRSCDLSCNDCISCIKACPNNAIDGGKVDTKLCLSAISQKKSKSVEDKIALARTKTVWGCDICQNACPFNKQAVGSPLVDFDDDAIENISAEMINEMDDNEYKKRAFSYREKNVISENLLTAKGKYDIIK